MRIIGGQYKGRRFEPSGKITARPTTDFAKEGLFNVLNNRLDFEEISALDLFAGIGSISLELASRGCLSVTAVEQSNPHLQFIRKVAGELSVNSLHTIQADVFRYLRSGSPRFNLIFADPPYELPELPALPNLIFERNLLLPDGLLVLEHPKKYSFSSHPHFSEHRSYGNVQFSFFE